MTESKRVKELKKQQKYDRMRDMRVVEYFDYPFVLADSPVEIVEGYVLVDRDTEEIFAEYVFKNIGSKPIAKLSITLEFYYYQNIPFNVTHFEYSQKDFKFGDILSKRTPIGLKNANRRDVVLSGECFGGNVLIKLPDQRWTKTKFKLVSVAFSDGKTQRLNKLVIGTGVRVGELSGIDKLVFDEENIFEEHEKMFPAKTVPQFSTSSWLCCCGNKNSVTSINCDKCGRNKEQVELRLSKNALQTARDKLVSDPKRRDFHDKSRFSQNKFLETQEERLKKQEQGERAIANIERRAAARERRKLMLLPRYVFFLFATASLAILIPLIPSLFDGSKITIEGLLELIYYILTS
ncbi:MAG: hypothetical protein IKM32_07490 [Clostridia bacterium]|nr:hypothetical protein [Clostridia bacterium]